MHAALNQLVLVVLGVLSCMESCLGGPAGSTNAIPVHNVAYLANTVPPLITQLC